jgi:hypothetical protein
VLLMVSDANILLDIEVGELAADMFRLPYRFVVPDVLYAEELAARHSHLLAIGLKTMTLSPACVARMVPLSQRYRRPSRNDLFALALAQDQQCPLLTGDAALRQAAVAENIDVRGTIWLMTELVRIEQVSSSEARQALERMRANGRRLPWELAEEALAIR